MAEWLESALCNTRVPTSNPALVALQKSNMFEITLVAEDHKPSMCIVCKPLFGQVSTCTGHYQLPLFRCTILHQ